jgi:hypothetical protein
LVFLIHTKIGGILINEQCTYRFELGNRSRTEATRFRLLTTAVHCTFKYVQLRHWFLFALSSGVYELSVNLPMANSVMHWRIRTFLDVSAALLYIGHCNQANALILVEILVILTCLVNVKYCSDFYAEEEFILCVRNTDFWWVSKVSCVGRVRKPVWVNLRELSNFGEQIFRTI